MIKSFSYIGSILFLMGAFLFYPKTDKKLSLLQWGGLTLFGYELFACFAGAVLTIVHIPAGIAYLTIVNITVSLLLLYGIFKHSTIQRYTISPWEILGAAILAGIVFALGWNRFIGFTTINYETSDPAVHMRMALNCLHDRSVISDDVGGMIITQFTNALWIELFRPIYSGAYSFIPFTFKDVYNLFLHGLIFYAAFRPTDKEGPCWQIYIVTIAYTMGYPLNNMLFGFQYLGMGVASCCFVLLCAQLHHQKVTDSIWLIVLMNFGCIGSSLSYTLFAPVVYIGLFLFLSWDFFQSREEKLPTKAVVSFMKLQLSVFLIPTILTLYLIVFVQIFSGRWADSIGTALSHDGYVYRNLYSDFVLILPFAIYGWWNCMKEKECNVLTFMMPIELIYSCYFWIQTLNGNVSTYYYYKLNYFNALILFGLAAIGIIIMCKKSATMVNSYLGTWLLIFTFWNNGTVEKIRQEDIGYAPFADEVAMFRIYETNRNFLSRTINESFWLHLSDAMIQLRGKDDRTNLILGDIQSSFWYEALADEKMSNNYAGLIGSEQLLDLFENDDSYGDYMAVVSESAEAQAVIERLKAYEIVFKCDGGYIVKRD